MKTVYLDNNATSRVAPEVMEAMVPYLGEFYGNPSSMHSFGGQVAARLREAQKLGFVRAIVPETARTEAPEGFSLSTLGSLTNLVVDIAGDGMPARRRAGRQEA